MPLITTKNEISVYCEDFGHGSPVVFTSAGLLTHKQWEHQVAVLAAGCRTITYDWCGTGRSDKPNIAYTAALAVDVLCDLIESLGARPVTLIGHGIGNHVNVLTVLKRPELVDRLMIVSGAPWYQGDHDGAGGFSNEFMSFWKERMSQEKITSAQAYSDLGDQYLFYRTPHPAVGNFILEQAFEWPLYVFKSYTASMSTLDLRPVLKQVQHPTLVVHGRHDKKQRYEGGVYFSKNIPGARFVTLEESAHMPMLEEMSNFNKTIFDFLPS